MKTLRIKVEFDVETRGTHGGSAGGTTRRFYEGFALNEVFDYRRYEEAGGNVYGTYTHQKAKTKWKES